MKLCAEHHCIDELIKAHPQAVSNAYADAEADALSDAHFDAYRNAWRDAHAAAFGDAGVDVKTPTLLPGVLPRTDCDDKKPVSSPETRAYALVYADAYTHFHRAHYMRAYRRAYDGLYIQWRAEADRWRRKESLGKFRYVPRELCLRPKAYEDSDFRGATRNHTGISWFQEAIIDGLGSL